MPRATDADAIRRKAHIPDDVRTEGKDAAAEIIDRVIEAGEWPVALTELADSTEWSRSHYANTLADYYQPVDDSTDDPVDTDGLHITVPNDVDKMSYLRGWMDCYANVSHE